MIRFILGCLMLVVGMACAFLEYSASNRVTPPLWEVQRAPGEYAAPFESPPFPSGEAPRRREFRIQVSAPVENAWVYVQLEALDAASAVVAKSDVSVSYYQGMINGRAWKTGAQTATGTLLLPATGAYRFRVTVQAGAGATVVPDTVRTGPPMHLAVYEIAPTPRRAAIASVVFFVLGLSLTVRGYRPADGSAKAATGDGVSLPSTSSTPANEAAYMPQLDGLRAIAVLLVLNYHFLSPELHFWMRPLLDRTGNLSVRLFFVLSGFLITGILLRCRPAATSRPRTLAGTLGQFYARRFLRIFPLYYLVLGAAALLNLQQVRAAFSWHAAYLTNVYYVMKGTMGDGPCSHFWSLAVEEQFYLLWPLLILTLPRRYLGWAMAGAFLLGPAFRVTNAMMEWGRVASFYLAPANLDSLAAGALLAYSSSPVFGSNNLRRRMEQIGLLVGLPVAVMLLAALHHGWDGRYLVILFDVAMAWFFVWLVGRSAAGFPGVIGRWLGQGILPYIGRISYGVYVYHLFVFWVVVYLPPETWPGNRNLWVYLLSLGVTLLLATLSFYGVEQPINNLKHWFPYAGTPSRAADKSPASSRRS